MPVGRIIGGIFEFSMLSGDPFSLPGDKIGEDLAKIEALIGSRPPIIGIFRNSEAPTGS